MSRCATVAAGQELRCRSRAKKHGQWRVYEGSQLVRLETYDDGELLRWVEYDEAGRPVARSDDSA